jgi:hypothetical protein
MATIYNDQVNFQNNVTIGRSAQFSPPPGFLTDQHVAAGAGVQAAKLIHQEPREYAQSPGAAGSGTAIVADTKDIYVARNAGQVVGVQAAITGALPSGNYTVNVDLQRSTGGGAFASILSATIAFSSSSTLRSAVAGVLAVSPQSYNAGDILRVVVTVAGSSGAQGQGLVVTIYIQEVGG